jgi:hypothetical protein
MYETKDVKVTSIDLDFTFNRIEKGFKKMLNGEPVKRGTNKQAKKKKRKKS